METQSVGTSIMQWEPEALGADEELKHALVRAPALSLPIEKDFNPYVMERKGMALGVITQPRGPTQ